LNSQLKTKPIILGSALCVVYLLLLYWLDPYYYANIYFRFIIFLFVLGFMIYTAIFQKYDVIDKLRTFVRPPFFCFVIIMFWVQLTHFALFNWIHPVMNNKKPLSEFFRKADYDFQYKRLEAGGAELLEFKKMKAEINSRTYGIDPRGAVKQYVYFLFYGFIISFIIALIVRIKEQKEQKQII
jgi:hypothetical protein